LIRKRMRLARQLSSRPLGRSSGSHRMPAPGQAQGMENTGPLASEDHRRRGRCNVLRCGIILGTFTMCGCVSLPAIGRLGRESLPAGTPPHTTIQAPSSAPASHPTQTLVASTASPSVFSAPAAGAVQLQSLPPGDYLAYALPGFDDQNMPIVSLVVRSVEGSLAGVVAFGPGSGARLSPDLHWVAFIQSPSWSRYYQLRLLFLVTGEVLVVPRLFEGRGISWSPDGNYLAVADRGEILLLRVPAFERTRLTDCAYTHPDGPICDAPLWSPQGTWIAYYRTFARSGPPSSTDGLYVLDTGCLSEPASCSSASLGPLGWYRPFTWSHSGERLAAVAREQNGLRIDTIEIPGGRTAVLLEMDAGAEDIAWSPDGQYIAATRNGSVCIIDIATGEERLIESGPVELYSVVWFTVPVLPDDRPGSAGPH